MGAGLIASAVRVGTAHGVPKFFALEFQKRYEEHSRVQGKVHGIRVGKAYVRDA